MSDLRYDVDGAVATATLNRPDSRNAYSEEMAAELVDALDRAESDESVRVFVVTGAGDAFCAGGDLEAMRDRSGMFSGDPVELRDNYLRGLQHVPRRFERFEKPTLAAINGPAIGAGLGLALMCDLRIAVESATFGIPAARVGVIPGDGGAYLLQRVVGFAKAVELLLTAEIVEADEALEIDLITRAVPDDKLLDETESLAHRIAGLPQKAVQTTKAALYRCVDQDFETSLQITAALQSCIQHTDEHETAVRELLESLDGSNS